MKTIYLSICFMLIFSCYNIPAYSQQSTKRYNQEQPALFTPKNHDPNFLKAAQFPDKSFYQQKSEWKHIIDTTWGPGVPLADKLKIFNTYSQTIHDKFDGLNSLKLNWDSLKDHYLNQITDTTSKGAFSSIMSHFASELKDCNTYAWDTTVIHTALEPGVPILIIGKSSSIEHFGAATTVLADSTTLVLRVAPNHPLNLEPGDIILGYEGVPWTKLARELFHAGLPMFGRASGNIYAETYHKLNGVGLNWHLFGTIDILKYSGDTLHLSLEPMVDYHLPIMINNEQLPIPNIPFPKPFPFPEVSDSLLTYGIMKDTHIGYIYLPQHFPVETVDKQFYEIVDSLKNTDALIIDLRYNISGDAFLFKGFDVLFNEFHKTLEDAYRCNTNTFELCPHGNWGEFQIRGLGPDYYDRPIAVLLGPSSRGMGDITAYRLRYHPMARFFGANPGGSLGINFSNNIPDWELNCSMSDVYYTNDPGTYLNRKEFPIDYPVWFNKEDVAKGIDPIVEKAREWINNLAYGHSIVLNKSSFPNEKDTLKATAMIENPQSHEILVKLLIESLDSTVMDSTQMKPINLNEGNDWQGIFETGNLPENFYWLSVKVEDKTNGTFFTNRHMTRITTVPLIIVSLDVKKTADYKYTIQPYFKNAGDSVDIEQTISVTLTTNPWVTSITPQKAFCATLKPGEVKKIAAFKLTCDTTTFQNHFDLKFTVSSQDWPYWVIDKTITVIPTSIETNEMLPMANILDKNYPNPFNVQTTIPWQLASGSRASLSVYDIMGRKVATLVDEYRSPGKYETHINASTLPKGIYFYQLKAGKFIQTRKMILVK